MLGQLYYHDDYDDDMMMTTWMSTWIAPGDTSVVQRLVLGQRAFTVVFFTELLRRFRASQISLETAFSALGCSCVLLTLVDILLGGNHYFLVLIVGLPSIVPATFIVSGNRQGAMMLGAVWLVHGVAFWRSLGRRSLVVDRDTYWVSGLFGLITPGLLYALMIVYQREREHREKVLMETIRAKTMFITNISHELRTPLHGLLATAELMKDTQLSAFQREYLDAIEACGRFLFVRVVGRVVAVVVLIQPTAPIILLQLSYYNLPDSKFSSNDYGRKRMHSHHSLEPTNSRTTSNACGVASAGHVSDPVGSHAGPEQAKVQSDRIDPRYR